MEIGGDESVGFCQIHYFERLANLGTQLRHGALGTIHAICTCKTISTRGTVTSISTGRTGTAICPVRSICTSGTYSTSFTWCSISTIGSVCARRSSNTGFSGGTIRPGRTSGAIRTIIASRACCAWGAIRTIDSGWSSHVPLQRLFIAPAFSRAGDGAQLPIGFGARVDHIAWIDEVTTWVTVLLVGVAGRGDQ